MRLLGISLLIGWFTSSYPRNNDDTRYRHYTTEDGLPSSTVFYILQDQRGFMWFSTDAGVIRYDGYSFQNFSKKNGLPDNVIHTMYEDREGRLWFIGMKWQLSYYRNDSIYLFNPGNQLDGLNTDDIFQDKEGVLWFSFYNGGLFRYADGKLEKYNDVVKELPIERLDFVQDSSGRYLVSTLSKYGYLQNGSVTYYSLPEKVIVSGDYTRFFVATSGLVIGRSKTYLYEIKDDSVNSFFPPPGFPENTQINMLTEAHDRSLLVSTNHGGYQLKKSGFDYEVSNTFLGSQPVNMVYEDGEHNLWFSTRSDGIYFLSNTARMIAPITIADVLNNDIVYSIAKMDGGVLCLGSQNGLLHFFKNGKSWNISLENAGIINNVNYLLTDEKNTLWCALDGGIFFIKENEIEDFKPAAFSSRQKQVFDITPVKDTFGSSVNYIIGGSVKSISKGKENEIWFASSVGLYRIVRTARDKMVLFRYSRTRVTDVCAGNGDKVWFCNPNGLTYLVNDSITKTGEYLLQNENISDIEKDENGRLWIATNGSGIYVMKDTIIGSITTNEGLASDKINSLFIDGPFVWASTAKGLNRIEFSEGKQPSFKIFRLGKSDGLPSEEINRICIDKDTVYVATDRSAVIFSKSEIFTKSLPPTIYVQGININGKDTVVSGNLSLKHFQNNVSITALGISYKSTGNLQYKYLLEGVDSDWKLSRTREINYPSLPPGSYNFLVKAVNEDAVESNDPARVSFTINPPFWQTTWFRISMVLVFLFIVLGIILSVVRYYRNQNKLLNRIFDAEQKALRAQMNPHFVFNALYSIQNFITKNDQYSANIYLAKFSDLVRMTLDYSRNVSITIAEELKFLNTYLELESLRFENKFDYKINVDSSVDVYKMKILSMLIQPFVENSIKHGLLPKNTKGEIKIGVTKENGFLSCMIEDNGIGREKAMEYKNMKSSAHISQGIAITQERLALLKNGRNNGSIAIIDMMDDKGNTNGTRVIIKIPYSE